METAYRAGKKEALQDVLEFIQASLDHPAGAAAAGLSAPSHSHSVAGASSPNVTARLIDYLEVRSNSSFSRTGADLQERV